jgi:hypothetical protein
MGQAMLGGWEVNLALLALNMFSGSIEDSDVLKLPRKYLKRTETGEVHPKNGF